ncbi:MAG: hypothetical protein K2V38_20995 [Gemmataceae bacterium]|nr:hypothetical protein [Gemmataceae bacterium]
MNEAFWWAYTNPQPLLEFLGPEIDPRLGRLFAVWCVRRVVAATGFSDKRSLALLGVAEGFADGAATQAKLSAAVVAAQAVARAAPDGTGERLSSRGRSPTLAGAAERLRPPRGSVARTRSQHSQHTGLVNLATAHMRPVSATGFAI